MDHGLKENFERDGYAIVRGAVGRAQADLWRALWDDWHDSEAGFGRKVNPFNPVAVDTIPPGLEDMPAHPQLLDIVEAVFGPDIALYNHRFVVKDQHSREPVFLHQDTPYHVGWPTKASLFVALSEMHTGNGGLIFVRGSHRWGYLGDAGEISNDTLRERALSGTVTDGAVSLTPGDAVLMHSACWHASLSHQGGDDRILADIIYQPANDPSGIKLLRGKWRCEPQPWLRSGKIFARSRTSRLAELQAKVNAK